MKTKNQIGQLLLMDYNNGFLFNGLGLVFQEKPHRIVIFLYFNGRCLITGTGKKTI
jgi:TATA-box binding protein (TBP) (component of TFIID and TFIIIB)